MVKPIARWTIGNTTKDGYRCLTESIFSFLSFYDAEVIICHNCDPINLPDRVLRFRLFDQRHFASEAKYAPKGVAWKLYPPRIDKTRHEIVVDNDIVFLKPIKQIEEFFNSDCTLLLEGDSRTYGRFEKHVPPGVQINSGIYGMPPGFDLNTHCDFFAGEWEKNAFGEHDKNETFDEQGLVAFALLSHKKYVIIPNTSVANCERQLQNQSDAYHFIGLNRKTFHKSYRIYKSTETKLFL
jgi:hypothetical protein